jgi:hypothetical protein
VTLTCVFYLLLSTWWHHNSCCMKSSVFRIDLNLSCDDARKVMIDGCDWLTFNSLERVTLPWMCSSVDLSTNKHALVMHVKSSAWKLQWTVHITSCTIDMSRTIANSNCLSTSQSSTKIINDLLITFDECDWCSVRTRHRNDRRTIVMLMYPWITYQRHHCLVIERYSRLRLFHDNDHVTNETWPINHEYAFVCHTLSTVDTFV